MITIMPADKAFLQEIGAADGVDAMVLRDSSGSVDGYALFRADGNFVELLAVKTDLPMMGEGLIRSVLNTGDCRGAVKGICYDHSLATTLRRLEFEEENGAWTVSIEKFFRGDCKCGK